MEIIYTHTHTHTHRRTLHIFKMRIYIKDIFLIFDCFKRLSKPKVGKGNTRFVTCRRRFMTGAPDGKEATVTYILTLRDGRVSRPRIHVQVGGTQRALSP